MKEQTASEVKRWDLWKPETPQLAQRASQFLGDASKRNISGAAGHGREGILKY
jgi:hypothetical protein